MIEHLGEEVPREADVWREVGDTKDDPRPLEYTCPRAVVEEVESEREDRNGKGEVEEELDDLGTSLGLA
jgi:hypothetical protein